MKELIDKKIKQWTDYLKLVSMGEKNRFCNDKKLELAKAFLHDLKEIKEIQERNNGGG